MPGDVIQAVFVDPCIDPGSTTTTTTVADTTTTTVDGDAGAGVPSTTTPGELPATGGSVPYWSLVWLGIALVIPGLVITVLASRRQASIDT